MTIITIVRQKKYNLHTVCMLQIIYIFGLLLNPQSSFCYWGILTRQDLEGSRGSGQNLVVCQENACFNNQQDMNGLCVSSLCPKPSDPELTHKQTKY